MASYFLSSLGKGNRALGQRVYDSRNFFLGFFTCICSASLFTTHIYDTGWGEGESMFPTIPDHLTLLFINKTYAGGKGIKVGDYVQLQSPLFPKYTIGKRVIALPGDYVLRTPNGSPTPGGAPLCGVTDWRRRIAAERRMAELEFGVKKGEVVQRSGAGREEEEEEWDEPKMIQVPEGHAWVEGDNIGWSRDSKFFGAVPMALIKGRGSGFAESLFSFTSLRAGKGLRKVEDWEMEAVLGEKVDEEKSGERKAP